MRARTEARSSARAKLRSSRGEPTSLTRRTVSYSPEVPLINSTEQSETHKSRTYCERPRTSSRSPRPSGSVWPLPRSSPAYGLTPTKSPSPIARSLRRQLNQGYSRVVTPRMIPTTMSRPRGRGTKEFYSRTPSRWSFRSRRRASLLCSSRRLRSRVRGTQRSRLTWCSSAPLSRRMTTTSAISMINLRRTPCSWGGSPSS
mmetsp:Transcript_29380/g.44373  ORF Transcript_29380/g.44373 Transcript_29380/m.44373 type:complete len:201 (+) Transcript_29380:491-1093(+)